MATKATFPNLDQIKQALGIECAVTADDEAIQALLDSTIALIESYLGRGIAYATETQEFDPPDSGNPALMLWRFPVESVESVMIEGRALSGYRVYKNPGIVRWRFCCAYPPGHCCHNAPSIEVTYTGGYANDAWPADLLGAVMQTFYGRWSATNGTGNIAQVAPGGSVRSVSVDGLSVNYDSATFAGSGFAGAVVPPELANVAGALDPYRVRLVTGV